VKNSADKKLILSKLTSLAIRFIIYSATFLTVSVLIFIIAYILIKGIPNITPSLFSWHYDSENVSMLPSIINTLLMTLLTLAIAVPVGILSAIYLVEYARRGSKIVTIIRIANDTLAGIPSIVYGLFGYIALVITLKWSYSLLAGAVTLSILVLPIIIRTPKRLCLPFLTHIAKQVTGWVPENCAQYSELFSPLLYRAFFPESFWL
jgi:phosphate transport system permease protein